MLTISVSNILKILSLKVWQIYSSSVDFFLISVDSVGI